MAPSAMKPLKPSTAMCEWPTVQLLKCVTFCKAGSDCNGPWMQVSRYQIVPASTNRPAG